MDSFKDLLPHTGRTVVAFVLITIDLLFLPLLWALTILAITVLIPAVLVVMVYEAIEARTATDKQEVSMKFLN